MIIICLLAVFAARGQKDNSFYQKIEKAAMPNVTPIVSGKIKGLKNITPPEKTWTYENLVRYKSDALANESGIRYGKYIEPMISGNGKYAYNYFAYKPQKDHGEYYFAIIIEVDTSQGFKVTEAYLFTEEYPVKSWWKHTLWFYESDLIDEIPDEYLYPFCPPPPTPE